MFGPLLQSTKPLTATTNTLQINLSADGNAATGAGKLTAQHSASSGPGTAKTPGAYLCWVQWKTAIPQLAPIFVQGALQAK